MEQLETNIISNTKKLNDMKTAVSENAAQIKAHTTIVNAGAETVESMRAQLALNTKALNKMSVEERTTKESGIQLVKQTKELSDRLKDLGESFCRYRFGYSYCDLCYRKVDGPKR